MQVRFVTVVGWNYWHAHLQVTPGTRLYGVPDCLINLRTNVIA